MRLAGERKDADILRYGAFGLGARDNGDAKTWSMTKSYAETLSRAQNKGSVTCALIERP
jgi:hypothetical protein